MSANLFDCTSLSVKNFSAHSTKHMDIICKLYVCTTEVLIFSLCTSMNCLVLSLGCVHTTLETTASDNLFLWRIRYHEVPATYLLMLQVKGVLGKTCWRSLSVLRVTSSETNSLVTAGAKRIQEGLLHLASLTQPFPLATEYWKPCLLLFS